MKPLYIFDLDGTLALIDHRRSILDDTDSNKWRRFYAACDKDLPNKPVINVMESLIYSGADVWIFSGRSDEVREKTIEWLIVHTSFTIKSLETKLIMRHLGDYTPDDVLKKKWFDNMLLKDKQRLRATFDDRDRIVAMWRNEGITCFQVAPGNF